MKTSQSLWAAGLLAASSLAVQPSSPQPIEAPLRELPWSNQINFLHTTDTHGWHAGHLQEASYTGDWGDYISFAHHLRGRANKDGSDLLLIDSGDRVEGNGLYDSSNPKGKYTYQIYKEQEVDILVCGNHELYKINTSNAEYKQFIPHYKNNYIASNIDILDPKSGERVPLAQRFRKFKTKNQNIQIMAFGFLFDFKGSSNHSFVKRVEDVIQEQWFQDAIRDKSVDLFVVAGHAEVRSQEFIAIFDEIRKQRWDTPIMFFGGHLHIRDYKKFDDKAFALASGRYMETIGFQSISGLSIGKSSSKPAPFAGPNFARKYIDNNRYSLQHHSGTNKESFDTLRGLNVSASMTDARHALKLDMRFGCAPRDLWTNRAPYPTGEGSENSIYTWLEKDVLPEMVNETSRQNTSRIIMANTGTMRFDVFKGAFTRDTTWIIQPFTNSFRYLPDVPFDKANQLLGLLNKGGHVFTSQENGKRLEDSLLLSPEQRGLRLQEISGTLATDTRSQRRPGHHEGWSGRSDGQQIPLLKPSAQKSDAKPIDAKPAIFPGYTTVDDAGNDGDDTEHSPIVFFRAPNVFEARVGFEEGKTVEKVDFVFLDFIQPWVLSGLKFLGAEYTPSNTKPYVANMDFTTMISTWVTRHWNNTEC